MSHTFHLANPGLRLDNRTGSVKDLRVYRVMYGYIGVCRRDSGKENGIYYLGFSG